MSPGFQGIGTDPTCGILRTLLSPREQVSLDLKNALAFQTVALTYERSGNLDFSPAQQMGLPDKRQAYWSTCDDGSLLGDH